MPASRENSSCSKTIFDMFISRRLLLISKIPSPFAKNRKKEARFRPQPRQMRNKLHYYGDNGNTEGEDESSVDEDDSSLPGGGYMRKRKASVFMLSSSSGDESSIKDYMPPPYLRHSSLSEGLKRPLMHRTEDEDVTSENYHRIDMGPNLS